MRLMIPRQQHVLPPGTFQRRDNPMATADPEQRMSVWVEITNPLQLVFHHQGMDESSGSAKQLIAIGIHHISIQSLSKLVKESFHHGPPSTNPSMKRRSSFPPDPSSHSSHPKLCPWDLFPEPTALVWLTNVIKHLSDVGPRGNGNPIREWIVYQKRCQITTKNCQKWKWQRGI